MATPTKLPEGHPDNPNLTEEEESMMYGGKPITFSFSLPSGDYRRLQRRSQVQGVSMGQLARDAVAEFLRSEHAGTG